MVMSAMILDEQFFVVGNKFEIEKPLYIVKFLASRLEKKGFAQQLLDAVE